LYTNPIKAEKDWPPVVVCGAYWTGLLLAKNLLRRGVNARMVDCNSGQVGFRSRLVTAHRCPNPDTHAKEWLAYMISLARTLGGTPALISSADQFVTAIAVHAEHLAKHYRFCDSATGAQALLAKKDEQYVTAREHKMPIPHTATVHDHYEVESFAEAAVFPCIMKPLHQRYWEALGTSHPMLGKKLMIASTAEELVSQYNLVAATTPRVVVQEIIEGPDTAKLVYFACYAKNGDRIANCMAQEVRTIPVGFGSASVLDNFQDGEADSICDQFLRKIGYSGLCEIELKRDSRTGKLMMIEANPRYSYSADFCPCVGVDLGWVHYLDLIGARVTPVRPIDRTVRHVILERDARAVRVYLDAGLETWCSIIRSYSKRPICFCGLDACDWQVTLECMINVARTLCGYFVRKLVPKTMLPPRACTRHCAGMASPSRGKETCTFETNTIASPRPSFRNLDA